MIGTLTSTSRLHPGRFLLVGILWVCGPSMLGAAPTKPDFVWAAGCIEGMRADLLFEGAAARVEMVMGERRTLLVNRAAYAVLFHFFDKHRKRSFRLMHTGTDQGGQTAYLLGMYEDLQGKRYRVRLLWENQEGAWRIHKVHFLPLQPDKAIP